MKNRYRLGDLKQVNPELFEINLIKLVPKQRQNPMLMCISTARENNKPRQLTMKYFELL